MASFEEELRLDEEENRKEMAYIRERLPLDARHHYSDNEILYMMDQIVDYYYTSGILESDADEVDIDMEEVAKYVCKNAKRDGHGTFDPQDVFFVVQADLDYQEEHL